MTGGNMLGNHHHHHYQEGDAPDQDDVNHRHHFPGSQHAQMYHWAF